MARLGGAPPDAVAALGGANGARLDMLYLLGGGLGLRCEVITVGVTSGGKTYGKRKLTERTFY